MHMQENNKFVVIITSIDNSINHLKQQLHWNYSTTELNQ